VSDDLSNDDPQFVGVCPHCHGLGIFLNVEDHGCYLICHAHKVFWWASGQYHEDAPEFDDPESLHALAELRSYREVTPRYPGGDENPPPEPERRDRRPVDPLF
jgi:hypothetical protein